MYSRMRVRTRQRADPSLVLDLPLYKLDGSSFSSKDRYGHLCTVTGALWRPNGRYFDGTDDLISTPDVASLGITGTITVLVWVKGAAQSDKGVIGQYDYGNSQRAWDIVSGVAAQTAKFVVNITDNGIGNAGHKKTYQSSITVFDNSWHLIGFTFNAGTLTLFIEGVADSNPTKTLDDAITTIHDSTAAFQIGALLNNGVTSDFFTGVIGEVLWYNRALSVGEIMRNYQATKRRYI